MRIFMTGGTGFVGTTLSTRLAAEGHEVTILSRHVSRDRNLSPGITLIQGDPTQKGPWQDQLDGNDVFINLAGASIFRRWTQKAKTLMRESRLQTTGNLVNALARVQGREIVLLSASAVGYYGFHENEILGEESPHGNDYLATLAVDWEKEALRAEEYGVRVLLCRFGIVLGRHGGALGQMLPLFRKGLGSALGTGNQWFPWIHEQDLVNIFRFLVEQKGLSGPINFTAPEPVTNREFTKALGKALGKPTFLPAVPGFFLKIMKGEFGTVLLRGQRVIPKKLLHAGFRFRFPTIQDALTDLVS
ncbi:MAG: TIGR01777 family oxidoreductase [Deltaproteobacteria bacterium]|nr:TIGR01777 family oxidoreductase [Deltaproteobacteria bacterium]